MQNWEGEKFVTLLLLGSWYTFYFQIKKNELKWEKVFTSGVKIINFDCVNKVGGFDNNNYDDGWMESEKF